MNKKLEERARRRVFRISGNNKGLTCPFKPIVCPGGHCLQCQIYLDWLKLEEKVVICLGCGNVIRRNPGFGRPALFQALCDECDKEGGSEKDEN